jgi:ATP-dependent protease ClpP protease subunit
MTGPAHARPWFRLGPRNAADDGASGTSADVFIYDEIGESFWGGGVSAQMLANQLAALDVDTIRVFINSPGGAAWDGISIMNALRRHSATIEVHVDGLAASAASVIAMAGDRIIMNRGSQLMIHDASAGAYGDAELMAEVAAILTKLSDSIADVYAGRAGSDRATWRAAMQAETWYTAEEAVAAGLADEWVDAPTTNPVDRARFSAHARAAIPSLASLDLPTSPEAEEITNRKELLVSDNLQTGIRELLGVTDADATDEQLLAAARARLTESASTTPTVPEGAIVVDAAAFAELQRSAAAGVTALEAIDSARRDGIIDAAIREGRIAPAARDTWRPQLDTNESGAVAILATLPKNTVPVTEIGHADVSTEADDSYPANWKR